MNAECREYYWAGIGIVAAKLGIKIEYLTIGDFDGINGEAKLESLEQWCDASVDVHSFRAKRVEDYCTALLAGSAGRFICAESRRCHLKRTLGSAGLEEGFLRELYECVQCEPDRAMAIIVGSLGDFDDGDAKATTRRLWHRAIRILRQPMYNNWLKRLIWRLKQVREIDGIGILRLLEP
jgi:hypothetical protein